MGGHAASVLSVTRGSEAGGFGTKGPPDTKDTRCLVLKKTFPQVLNSAASCLLKAAAAQNRILLRSWVGTVLRALRTSRQRRSSATAARLAPRVTPRTLAAAAASVLGVRGATCTPRARLSRARMLATVRDRTFSRRPVPTPRRAVERATQARAAARGVSVARSTASCAATEPCDREPAGCAAREPCDSV